MKDFRARIASQPRRRWPHLLAQEGPEIVGGIVCVEEEIFHDVVRIVLGLKNLYRGDASLLPHGRAAGEVLQPRAEVGDPVFDAQDAHWQSVAEVERPRCLPAETAEDHRPILITAQQLEVGRIGQSERKRHGVVKIADVAGASHPGNRQVKSRNRTNSANAADGRYPVGVQRRGHLGTTFSAGASNNR